jgi:hypothetical protein
VSESTKRPGTRDISELKARLGLKKGNATPAAGARPPGARGVLAPPGAQPARPAIPDASHDPFGAMNAMAAHGAVAAQPQIVIVNDGAPVESVEHKRRGVKLAIYAALFLVPLIFGSILGKIAAQNKAFNGAIGDAAKLRDDVKVIGKGMISVQQVLQVGMERGGGRGFLPNDAQLTTDLEALQLVEPAFDLLSTLDMSAIGDVLAKETMELYSETARLNADIKEHVAKSKADQKAIEAGAAKAGEFVGKAGPTGYGALVTMPTGDAAAQPNAFATVQLVQLGLLLCAPDNKPAQSCPGGAQGAQYRLDEAGAWGSAPFGTAAGVADRQLLVLDPGSKVLEGLMKGGEATVAEAGYKKRITDIAAKVELLVELRKNVETKLNNVANRDTRPTFFL